jgi:hypothetical protein
VEVYKDECYESLRIGLGFETIQEIVDRVVN